MAAEAMRMIDFSSGLVREVTRLTQPSAVTRSHASVVRTTRWRWSTTLRRKSIWWTGAPSRLGFS